ncbi:hypothetical protein HPB52_007303 [Rhipicephalus sanguineus]|uniref:Uncharacterized protein n=1 Tax=Rhipicephalus sanguineus TaxID=34632 RepID=A0A9D4Q5C1_RHISA|nr:hypothetical protein HPB52_007303 [Rhipicephalus sanguineus]
MRLLQESQEVPLEPEEPFEGWYRLDAGCTADFCTADDNLATCGARMVEDIVEEATCELADSSDDDDDTDEGDGEGPPPAAETLQALYILRHSFLNGVRWPFDMLSDDDELALLSSELVLSWAGFCRPAGGDAGEGEARPAGASFFYACRRTEWLSLLCSSPLTPTTIANCFAKCGFFRSSEEVPSEQEEPIEGWELLDAGCTAEDFCTADDNLATCGARTVEDIVEEATCEVADSSDDGDNIDEGDGEGPPPAAETLHALDVLRRAMAADEISDDTCTRFYGFQRSLLSDFAKKKKQKDIRDFFCKK